MPPFGLVVIVFVHVVCVEKLHFRAKMPCEIIASPRVPRNKRRRSFYHASKIIGRDLHVWEVISEN